MAFKQPRTFNTGPEATEKRAVGMTGDGYLIEGAAATPETVRDIRNRITHFSRGHGATEDQTGDIALAVTEATTNVARHAYPNHSEGTLDLTSRVEDGTLIVEIRDFGVGVEAQGANSGLGLGLVLMAKLTASWDVEPANPGTRVTLRFALTES